MQVNISTFLPIAPEKLIEELKSPKQLQKTAAPLVYFDYCGEGELSEKWQPRAYLFSVRLFGFLPFGKHTMVFTYPDSLSIRDNGYSGLCKKWDHLMTVRASAGGCIYTDCAQIEAGILTPVLWLFGQAMYRFRQRSWRKYVATLETND